MRQEDVAGLAEVSVRVYGAFERGDYPATAQVVDRIAAALQMSEAERSALHVLASRQDPPRRLTPPARNLPGEQDQALRDLVSCSPYAAALTDETWTVLHHNHAMSAWAGGWFESVAPADRHLVAYLFSGHAEASMPDIRAVRRASIAWLRYQYARKLADQQPQAGGYRWGCSRRLRKADPLLSYFALTRGRGNASSRPPQGSLRPG
jgi:transcriptional regulator with XRE-family HTH domain